MKTWIGVLLIFAVIPLATVYIISARDPAKPAQVTTPAKTVPPRDPYGPAPGYTSPPGYDGAPAYE